MGQKVRIPRMCPCAELATRSLGVRRWVEDLTSAFVLIGDCFLFPRFDTSLRTLHQQLSRLWWRVSDTGKNLENVPCIALRDGSLTTGGRPYQYICADSGLLFAAFWFPDLTGSSCLPLLDHNKLKRIARCFRTTGKDS